MRSALIGEATAATRVSEEPKGFALDTRTAAEIKGYALGDSGGRSIIRINTKG